MGKLKIIVQYKNEGIVDSVDRELKKKIFELGYKFVGQGYDFNKEIRDIQFER